jgi:hypothetical protein
LASQLDARLGGDVTRMRPRNLDLRQDARRPRAENHDPLGNEDGLLKLCVTKTTERRISRQSRRISYCIASRVGASSATNGSSITTRALSGANARDCNALLHASGQLVGIVMLEATKVNEIDERRRGRSHRSSDTA